MSKKTMNVENRTTGIAWSSRRRMKIPMVMVRWIPASYTILYTPYENATPRPTPPQSIFQTCELIVASRGRFENAGCVGCQKIALLDELCGRCMDALEVSRAVAVALFDGWPRVVSLEALPPRGRERNRRSSSSNQQMRATRPRMPRIPAQIRGQRHAQVGMADAADLVAIRVDRRQQVWHSAAGWQARPRQVRHTPANSVTADEGGVVDAWVQ